MDLEKLNCIADKLESIHIAKSAIGNEESKDILAIVQAYRIISLNSNNQINNNKLHGCLKCGNISAYISEEFKSSRNSENEEYSIYIEKTECKICGHSWYDM